MYCQHNSKLEDRQLSVKLFCASTVRGKTDNKTQCSSSSQCSLAAYPLLQAEETRNENCGINQSKNARNVWMPNLQTHNRKFRNISAGWLTPCNYMSYEMPEYILMQFLRILQNLMCRWRSAQYYTWGKGRPFHKFVWTIEKVLYQLEK